MCPCVLCGARACLVLGLCFGANGVVCVVWCVWCVCCFCRGGVFVLLYVCVFVFEVMKCQCRLVVRT
jgi:hypothetical protein